jgi:hypothetical protein
MDISDSTSPVANAVQLAVQHQVLAAMKTNGADIAELIASAPSPATGSVNSSSQGHYIDAFA